MKIVAVNFVNGFDVRKQYYFKTEEKLEQGDLVVVDTVNGFQVAKVLCYVELEQLNINVAKWVVCKVDTSKYQLLLKKEAKMEEIQKKLDNRKKQLEDIHIYQMLAEKDPEMKELLTEYLEYLK